MVPDDWHTAAAALRLALSDAQRGLVSRNDLLELVALGAIAEEHVLVVGPPGTAKSEAVRRFARGVEAQYFEYLLGRFTEPSELFGPVDLRKLRDGVVETRTDGMLPEAHVAFLDKVFLGSTAILNTLLGILNERRFRRGHTQLQCPLRVCVGASNSLPEEDGLAAFADRFTLRIFVEPVSDMELESLLDAGRLPPVADVARASIAQLDVLREAARLVDPSPVREPLAHAVRLLRRSSIDLSDRRVVKVQRLVCAAAVLGGRSVPTRADLWPIVFAVPTAEAQARARDILRDVLVDSWNSALPAAAESASAGPAARAARLVNGGRELLGARPPETSELGAWQLRLEGVAREIDAGFAAPLPADLSQLRKELVRVIGEVSAVTELGALPTTPSAEAAPTGMNP